MGEQALGEARTGAADEGSGHGPILPEAAARESASTIVMVAARVSRAWRTSVRQTNGLGPLDHVVGQHLHAHELGCLARREDDRRMQRHEVAEVGAARSGRERHDDPTAARRRQPHLGEAEPVPQHRLVDAPSCGATPGTGSSSRISTVARSTSSTACSGSPIRTRKDSSGSSRPSARVATGTTTRVCPTGIATTWCTGS